MLRNNILALNFITRCFSENFPVWVKSGSDVFSDTLHGRSGKLIYANGFRFLKHKATIADTECQSYALYY